MIVLYVVIWLRCCCVTSHNMFPVASIPQSVMSQSYALLHNALESWVLSVSQHHNPLTEFHAHSLKVPNSCEQRSSLRLNCYTLYVPVTLWEGKWTRFEHMCVNNVFILVMKNIWEYAKNTRSVQFTSRICICIYYFDMCNHGTLREGPGFCHPGPHSSTLQHLMYFVHNLNIEAEETKIKKN